mmetsp:Transcript_12824/g.57851  ORF Transcript_12824/g.57851 Transcript_12824/m.57851 type:complete len:240 (-) Transcript_12824:955-1674(-)
MSIAPDGYPTVQAQSMYMSKSRGSEYGRTISGSASGSSAPSASAGASSAAAGAASASPSASAAGSPSMSGSPSPSSPSSAGGASGDSPGGAAGAPSSPVVVSAGTSPAASSGASSALPSASAPSASRSASSAGSGHTSPAATVSATLRSTHFSQTRLLDKSSGTGQYTNRLTSFMKPLWSFLTHRYGSEEHPTIITRSPFFMPLTSFSRSFLIRLNSSLLLYSLSFFLSERKTFSSSST